MLFGAHCSGGVKKALDNGAAMGAEVVQLFAQSPRTWRFPEHDPADLEAFRLRREEMARVETDAEALVPPDRLEDRHELVERASHRSAGARGILHQQPRVLVAALEDLLDSRHDPGEARLEAGAEMGSDVKDHAVRPDRAARIDGRAHRGDALRVDGVFRGGEVDEVERMNEGGEARRFAL